MKPKRVLSKKRIKKKYLNRLSLELIKRGITEEQTKATLNEVSISLEDFIEESNVETLSQLEENFGSVEQFCENNSLNRNREASIGQFISLILIGTILTGIIILGISLLFMNPFNRIFSGREFVSTQELTVENGVVGTLFGLNMTAWIIYQYIRNRYSKWDIREHIKLILLMIYCFIFILWIIMVSSYYSAMIELIEITLSYGYRNLIIESAIRWSSIGIFLGITTALFTYKFIKSKTIVESEKDKDFVFDNLNLTFVYFIFSAFLLPYPGIGIIVLLIGVSMLFFTKITTGTWLIGSLALLMQLAIISNMGENKVYGITEQLIIFGIKISDFNLYNNTILIVIGSIIAFAVIWCIFGFLKISKNKHNFIPKFRLPKKKSDIVSVFLFIVILTSTLGSKPQYLVLEGRAMVTTLPDSHRSVVIDYGMPNPKGIVYISIYTYFEIFENYTLGGTYYKQEGNWSILLRQLSGPNSAEDLSFNGSLNDENSQMYYGDTYKLGLTYLKIEFAGHGDLVINVTYNYPEYLHYTPVCSVHWESAFPWVPTIIEPMILVISMISFFVKFENLPSKKKNEVEKIKEN